MKLVIPGGSGQVGTILARALHGLGHEVVVLTRQPTLDVPWRSAVWDATSLGAWQREIDGAQAVINLAGRSVNCRYTPRNRELINRSRVDTTQLIGQAITAAAHPPDVWLQASTATLYAHSYDAANDEATGQIGGDEPNAPDTWRFSVEVAKSWEAACDAFPLSATRLVKMRSAMVMSPDRGGVFDTLLALVRRGLGGTSGDGRQYVSWMHEDDFVAGVLWAIDRSDLEGAVNFASPHPVPNADFMRSLRQAWGTRFGLPASRWRLEIGAIFMQTETELVLKSRRVVPGRLVESGFEFKFPEWPSAARDLCRRWRAAAR